MDARLRLAHERTVRLYPWYAFLSGTYFWMPVFFLFFLRHLPLEQVLLLEAVYYAAVVALEVPSGYFSDRFGRRPTLVISTVSLAVAYSLFAASSSFVPFALAQVALAVGLAFNSGTDTSLHFDALAALGREAEYGEREAKVSRLAFQAGALGALGGGLAGLLSLRLAYVLSLASALGALGIVLAMAEPRVLGKALVPAGGFAAQARGILRRARHPLLACIFGFYVLMTVLNHVPYEFYQPYLDQLLREAGSKASATPLVAGVHFAAAMLVASWVAGRSIRIRDRVGLKGSFLAAAGIQTGLILAMAATVSWGVALLLLARSVPRALATAPINAAVAPLLEAGQRATWFSIQSLAGRLAFSVALVGFGVVGGAVAMDTMKASLLAAGMLGLAGCAALALMRRPAPGA